MKSTAVLSLLELEVYSVLIGLGSGRPEENLELLRSSRRELDIQGIEEGEEASTRKPVLDL